MNFAAFARQSNNILFNCLKVHDRAYGDLRRTVARLAFTGSSIFRVDEIARVAPRDGDGSLITSRILRS